MRDFDRDFADEVVRRVSALEDDRKPNWGMMRAGDLIPHLTHTVLWSMNRREPPPFAGNWLTVNMLGPLARRGWVPVLRNVKIKGVEGNAADTIADLTSALTDYLSAVETGGLEPAVHPLFGQLGVDGWARMHVKHFEHHFKQFDL